MEGHLGLLAGLVPGEVADFARRYVLDPQSAAADAALGLAADNRGVAGGLALLGLAAGTLVIAHCVGRLVLWWTRLTLRLAAWAVVAALAAWLWDRGPVASVRDAAVLAGRAAGYLAVLKDVWLDEYNRYERQQGRAARAGASPRH